MQLLHASAGTGRCMQCLWIRQSKQPDAAILSARGNLPEAALLHGDAFWGRAVLELPIWAGIRPCPYRLPSKNIIPENLYEETRCGLILR